MPDVKGAAALREAQSLGLPQSPRKIESANVYLLEGELDQQQVQQLAEELLADPVSETPIVGASKPKANSVIEVHPLPGVMDPDADAVKLAIKAMLGIDVEVRTGKRYDIEGVDSKTAHEIAERTLANTVIHAIHDQPYHPQQFPHGSKYELKIITVPLIDLDDAALMKLSREAHLFLSLDEMKAIQAEYRKIGRDPREIELETLAQTWSEHCVHKTMKSTIRYREESSDAQRPRIAMRGRPGHEINTDGSITIHNLLKSTVAAATHELMADGVDWCLSVFVDNAGVIAFDDKHAVCFKVETHNHPSAIEPYGGAATGIGGCIRDIIGTGLAAKPIAATDVFCVAYPDHWSTRFTAEDAEHAERENGLRPDAIQNSKSKIQNSTSAISASSAVNQLPAGVLHPKRILSQIVAGVRDYGNRMGIPTLNGAVWFDDNYICNPLVYCGVVGVMPRDKIAGSPQRGDRIIAVGGRTGRDGIHGATFSSAELTDTHADEFSHAVQIGNAVTEKVTLDAILEARDHQIELETPRLSDDIRRPIDRQLKSLGISNYRILDFIHINPQGYRAIVGTDDGRLFEVDSLERESPKDISEFIETVFKRSAAVSRWHSGELPLTAPLFSAITDCGAGGFSSAVGEMGKELGATVHLDRAPLKYSGLSPTEIWISEAQERMVLAVPPHNVAALQAICDKHGAEMSDLGEFGTVNGDLILLYHNTEVGRMPMHFLHEGLPEVVREAVWSRPAREEVLRRQAAPTQSTPSIEDALFELLAHPNIASKSWIIRQYDHEVQGRTVIKPLVTGENREGPGDAAVITPVYDSKQGLAIGNGLATGLQDDPYLMALAAIDECVRNLVCAGADPEKIAILDNFCWPSCNDPRNLGALVRAAEGCYDGAKAYRTPFISGKDSLNNQFTTEDGRTIKIPPTLLISGMGIVSDIDRCVTMDAKAAGNLLVIVGETDARLGGSHYEMLFGGEGELPIVDLQRGPQIAKAVASAIRAGLVRSAHDCSEGGLLVAAAEMAFAGGLGIELDLTLLPTEGELDLMTECFAETPSRYLLEIERGNLKKLDAHLRGVPFAVIGEFNPSGQLTIASADASISVEDLQKVWNC